MEKINYRRSYPQDGKGNGAETGKGERTRYLVVPGVAGGVLVAEPLSPFA